MRLSQIAVADSSSKSSARERLEAFLDGRRKAGPPEDVGAFEQQMHALFMAAEAEAMGRELSKFDLDAPEILVDGVPHRRVLRCRQTYQAASGKVMVERSLYSTRKDGERAVSPMEVRAGIIEGYWTPLAAKQAIWAVGHLVPRECAEMFEVMGGMKPSRSALDVLPKDVSERWEVCRPQFEAMLRMEETVPKEAAVVAVSLDGVLVPMKDGDRQAKRRRAGAEERPERGPSGYQEVGCGTVTLYDRSGKPLRTVRVARMPESKKPTLKKALGQELAAIRRQRPDLKLVKVADAARDNWDFLSHQLPKGHEVIDFYHATAHLQAALEAAYGEASQKAREQGAKLRDVLLEDPGGVDRVIRALVHLRDRHRRRKKIATELVFFRRNRHRMHYAEMAAGGLPIGSGITEAACKTLVTQRLKRSGMRWRHDGGQAILTIRAWTQSGRFDRAWALFAETYKQEAALPGNIIPMPKRVVVSV